VPSRRGISTSRSQSRHGRFPTRSQGATCSAVRRPDRERRSRSACRC
jgi:hypothetical protein